MKERDPSPKLLHDRGSCQVSAAYYEPDDERVYFAQATIRQTEEEHGNFQDLDWDETKFLEIKHLPEESWTDEIVPPNLPWEAPDGFQPRQEEILQDLLEREYEKHACDETPFNLDCDEWLGELLAGGELDKPEPDPAIGRRHTSLA